MTDKVRFTIEDEEFGFDTNVSLSKEKNGDYILEVECPDLVSDTFKPLHLTIREEEVKQC